VLPEIVHPGVLCAFGGIPDLFLDLSNFNKKLYVFTKTTNITQQITGGAARRQ
jgi:hypothetical protein